MGLAAAILLSSCGSSSPAAPSGVTPQTSVQVLRIGLAAATCPRPDVTIGLLGLLYTRVQVRQSSSEWTATSVEGEGDVEIRLTTAGASAPGFTHMTGTITGTARHVPALLPNLPAWESLMNFGSDRRTVLDAFSFAIPGSTPTTGVDGQGTGTVTIANSAGPQCSGTQFSFTIAPNA